MSESINVKSSVYCASKDPHILTHSSKSRGFDDNVQVSRSVQTLAVTQVKICILSNILVHKPLKFWGFADQVPSFVHKLTISQVKTYTFSHTYTQTLTILRHCRPSPKLCTYTDNLLCSARENEANVTTMSNRNSVGVLRTDAVAMRYVPWLFKALDSWRYKVHFNYWYFYIYLPSLMVQLLCKFSDYRFIQLSFSLQ